MALAAALAASIALTVVLMAGSSGPAPGGSEMASIRATATAFNAARASAVSAEVATASLATAPVVPQATIQSVSVAFAKRVSSLATAGFAASPGVGDFVQNVADMRRNGQVVVKTDCQILDLTYQRTLDNSDVVVWAKLWEGDVSREWGKAIGVGRQAPLDYVDDTPTVQYQLRKVGSTWVLVSMAVVFTSEDDSSTEYGPNTPHHVDAHALISGDQGLVLTNPTPTTSEAPAGQ